jgi:SAM-dependent methyltransferase
VIEQQRSLWSAAPRDWSELAEPQNHALFARLLDLCLVGDGTRLLDVACGSGYAAALAVERGASVTGVDVTPALLELALERAPTATFVTAGMDALPFADASFDVVTGVNGFQFALDPAVALAEAARVLVPGGRLAAATFAEPERNEGTALHLAMKALAEESQDGYTPYALSDGLADAVRGAGLDPIVVDEQPVTWRYPDAETTVRALLSSAGGARSVRAAGEARVREALAGAMAPFVDSSGAVAIRNVFSYVVAVRP